MLDWETVTIHHPKKTDVRPHPPAPLIGLMTW